MRTLNELFLQLGLPNDEASIHAFIQKHSMASKTIKSQKKPAKTAAEITKAPWWSPSQSEFLRQAIHEDSEWAIPVDELNKRLQQRN